LDPRYGNLQLSIRPGWDVKNNKSLGYPYVIIVIDWHTKKVVGHLRGLGSGIVHLPIEMDRILQCGVCIQPLDCKSSDLTPYLKKVRLPVLMVMSSNNQNG
jgi:hypothetical protein